MSLGRSTVEAIIIRRLGPWLAQAGLDATTIDGTNADLADAIGAAVRGVGGTTASYAAVTDADLLTVSDADQLLDLAELRTLEMIEGNLDKVTIASDGDSIALNDLSARVARALARKQARFDRVYGVTAPLAAGVLTLDVSTIGDDACR